MIKYSFHILSIAILLVLCMSASSFAQISYNGGGAGGGAIIVGESTTTCDSTVAGGMRYSTSAGCVELCDGASWKCMTKSSCDNSPSPYNFTNQTNLSLSTQYSSNIIAITGVAASCSSAISISGDGAPEYRICSTSNCSVVDIAWTTAGNSANLQGKYIQVRATTSASAGTTHTITPSVGGITSSWTITTSPADCSLSPIGTVCFDGSVYAGTTPDGNVPMYVTRCDYNMTWNGSACANARNTIAWDNGIGNFTDTSQADLCWPGTSCDPSGETNTTILVTEDSDSVTAGTQTHAAAKYCNDLVMHGQSDWYLPSAPELNVMYTNRTAIGNFAAIVYWASTEYNWQNAFYLNFSGGSMGVHFKNNAFYARCARK
jgi:hypothetical protein